jgi:hypothetical protein
MLDPFVVLFDEAVQCDAASGVDDQESFFSS